MHIERQPLALLAIAALAFTVLAHSPFARAASKTHARHTARTAAPLPPERQWWLTAEPNGRPLPVLTDPWWDRISATVVRDQATDLWWSNPSSLPVNTPLTFERAQAVCESNGGMRLPTRHDVESIIDRYRTKPVVDTTIFPDVVTDFYWTQTHTTNGAKWTVHHDDGRFVPRNAVEGSEARFFCVRYMRGPAPASHYAVTAASIRDNTTGLFWQTTLTTPDDLQQLADGCSTSAVAGMQWRVPTIKELLSIMSPERPSPHLDPVFGDTRALASSALADSAGGIVFQGASYGDGKRIKMEGTLTRCVSNGEPRNASTARTYKGNIEIFDGYENGNLALQNFEARQLRTIEGDVLLQGTRSAALVLPYLERIQGDLTITGTRLEEIHLPNLARVTGSITISNNVGLRKVSMRSLASVGKDFVVSTNTALGAQEPARGSGTNGGALRMDALVNVDGDVNLEYNPQLKTLYWPQFETVGRSLLITQNDALWWVQLRRLKSIGTRCTAGSNGCGTLDARFNQLLESLSMDLLDKVIGDVSLQGNGMLDDFANRLTIIRGGLYVEANKHLCASARIDPLIARMWQLGQTPAAVRIYNNDPSASCRTTCPNMEGSNCRIHQ